MILFLLSMNMYGQVTDMTFIVTVPKATDTVYITGNQPVLGDWDHGAVMMTKTSDLERRITLPVIYPVEFKFTKGNWDKEGYTNYKWDLKNLVVEKPVKESTYKILGWYNESRFSFNEDYIRANKGKFGIEVPEVQELVHIIIALTPKGIADKNMVNHEGKYYQTVLKEFNEYRSDPLVLQMQEFLKKGMYNILKMDACGFYFEGDEIKKDPVYDKLSWGGPNHIELLIPELERFARQTNFRGFYKSHSSYYEHLMKLMNKQIRVQEQWDWLEKNFKVKYDHYRITFSPLVKEKHSRNNFAQSDFKQTVIFNRGPFENSKYSEKKTEGLMAGMIFTEIDHNYVNPASDKHTSEIKAGISDLSAWATKNTLKDYPTEYAVFNEYMTWAVYSLYAKEKFEKEDFEEIYSILENHMTTYRGFKKFPEFNSKLMDLYEKRSEDQSIEDLYPEVVKWFGNAVE